MYKNHTAMPHIVQQQHAQHLKSISLIRIKMAQQKENGDVLQHSMGYVRSAAKLPLLCHDYDKDTFPLNEQCDSDSDDDEDEYESVRDAEEQTVNGAEKTEKAHTQSTRRVSMSKDTEIYDANETVCAVLDKYKDNNRRLKTVLALYIPDLNMQSPNFTHEVLDKMQQFITHARESLKQNKDPIVQHHPSILTHQSIHSHTCCISRELGSTYLHVQIQDDGRLQYIHTLKDECDDKNKLLCRQNYMLDTWSGKIQQIDYKHLYDSLDALFAIVYTHSHIQQVLSPIKAAKTEMCAIFHDMHFPNQEQQHVILHYTSMSGESPNMPIAAKIYSSKDKGITITELAHMSVLLDIHKHFVTAHETFAYQLARALLDDITTLWQIREELMPKQRHERDVYAYGIVPVVQDVLPTDFQRVATVFSVPEYMKEYKHHSQSLSQDYVCDLFTKGTKEMCTWCLAISCLQAATAESLGYSKEQVDFALKIDDMVRTIDKRFSHFSERKVLSICSTMLTKNIQDRLMQDVAGQAMPLFCMVICNVLSLSQALDKITIMHNGKRKLNKDNLISVHRDGIEQMGIK